MIGQALFAVLFICALHPHILVATSQGREIVETSFETIRAPDQVIEGKPIIVEERPQVETIVQNSYRTETQAAPPIVVEERPQVIVDTVQRPQVIVDTVRSPQIVIDSVPRPQFIVNSVQRPQSIVTSLRPPVFLDTAVQSTYGSGSHARVKHCINTKCSEAEKCIRRPAIGEANRIKARIANLRGEYNRNVAAEHQRHRAAMSGMNLHRYFYLPEKFNHACEYTSLKIDCPAGFVIDVINGFYGRQTNNVCYNKEIKNFHCSSGTAGEKIRALCNNKQSCKISSSNSVFSDPCVGTYKYTAVKYRCRLASSVQGFACEHNSLAIGCPDNYEVEVLHGFYGRETNDICTSREASNLRCRSPRATEVIRSLCDNRQGCTVASSNNIFGDPCVGTFKYMTVNYRCQISREIRHRHKRQKDDMRLDHNRRLKSFEESYIRQLQDFNQRMRAAVIGTEHCIPRKGPRCGSKNCKWTEKCVQIPAFNEVVKFEGKIARLREEHNKNLADANRNFQTAVGSMTLDHLYRLGEKSAHACEYTTLAIDCPPGYVIEVMKGFYGRETNNFCYNKEIKNFKCSSGPAKSKIRKLCGNKQSCKISSSNSVFGDPCIGTYKYTAVTYRCRLASSIEVHACEHKQLAISCPVDFEIEVLNGFYGRKTNKICYNKDVKDFNCKSGRATDVVRSLCNNKQACTVPSSNSFFGDPCVGTFKYTSVTYRCRVSSALRQRHDKKRADYAHGHNVDQTKLKAAFKTQLKDLQQRLHAAKRGSHQCVPKRLGVLCAGIRCKWSEKCGRVPSESDIIHITAKLVNLRNDFNKNLAAENRRYQAAIGSKTLDHLYRLGDKFTYACEYTSLKIECPFGFEIDVLSGYYGRQTNSVCFNKEITNFKCSSPGAENKIRRLCNNKRFCKISSSNSVFSDPCVGTYKYTSVKYTCRLASSVQVHACEHKSLPINCPDNYEIEVLSGFYGRQTNSICPNQNVKHFRCSSERATERIRALCNDRQGCTVASSNEVFGDPCVGTFKYMTITYRCRISRAIQQKFDKERAEISRDHDHLVKKLQRGYNSQQDDLHSRLQVAQRGSKQCVPK